MPFIVGLIVKGLTAFLTRLLVSLASEQMIAWVFFKVADAVVKSTATDKDDEFLAKIKDLYNSN